eukprot:331053-Rhodomonas_salina.4
MKSASTPTLPRPLPPSSRSISDHTLPFFLRNVLAKAKILLRLRVYWSRARSLTLYPATVQIREILVEERQKLEREKTETEARLTAYEQAGPLLERLVAEYGPLLLFLFLAHARFLFLECADALVLS